MRNCLFRDHSVCWFAFSGLWCPCVLSDRSHLVVSRPHHFSAANVLFQSFKKFGPVSQFDSVRLRAFRHRMLRSAWFSLVSTYFHTVSNVNIETRNSFRM